MDRDEGEDFYAANFGLGAFPLVLLLLFPLRFFVLSGKSSVNVGGLIKSLSQIARYIS